MVRGKYSPEQGVCSREPAGRVFGVLRSPLPRKDPPGQVAVCYAWHCQRQLPMEHLQW